MKAIKTVNNLFVKIFSASILVLLVLITSAFSNGFISSKQADALSDDANSYNAPLYEIETFYNIVILTELSDAKFNKNTDYPIIEEAFNGDSSSSNSLKKYFYEQSGKKLNIISVYMFCSSSTTTASFKKMNSTAQVSFVNSALKGEIYKDINGTQVFTGNLDMNGDSLIDSVTLYLPLSITNDDFSTAAWPHAIISSSNFNHKFKNLNYNRFVINSYKYRRNLITLSAPIGVMCHEMLHNIGNDKGVQDLYHYSDENDKSFSDFIPVGNYCVMAATDYQTPQPLNMYYKDKLGWGKLKETESGDVSLSKTEAEGIKFGVKDSEFFVAQYWSANNYNGPVQFSGSEGVIIYRVNKSVTTGNMGNIDGRNPSKKDEVYVFRKPAQGLDWEKYHDFPAVFANGENFKSLTYSDGENAKINVKISINKDLPNATITIERYAVEFKIDGTNVPYEISVQLNNGQWEETFSGAYVFTFADIAEGKVKFKCFGYKFYKDSNLTIPCDLEGDVNFVQLNGYGLSEKEKKFTITVYVEAIPRDVTVYFKDYKGDPLSFNLNSISYTFNGEDKVFNIENSSLELNINNFQVKNGDKIYFKLEINGERYRTEILEITPKVEGTAQIKLSKLCLIVGVVTAKGTPLPNVKILIDGEYLIIDGKEVLTDSQGRFALEDIPQGSIISFELENYIISDYTVTKDNQNLSIQAKNLSDNSLYVIIIVLAIIALIIIVTLTSIFVSKKRTSYLTNETYDE